MVVVGLSVLGAIFDQIRVDCEEAKTKTRLQRRGENEWCCVVQGKRGFIEYELIITALLVAG